MSGEGPFRDVDASRAKPRPGKRDRERRREADAPMRPLAAPAEEAEPRSAPSGDSDARESAGPPRGRTAECEARSLSDRPRAWGLQ